MPSDSFEARTDDSKVKDNETITQEKSEINETGDAGEDHLVKEDQQEVETNGQNTNENSDESEELKEKYGSYTPGTIVLAKLKSFPPWPAIVIPFELIPEGVLKSKPKKPVSHPTTSNSRSKRKSTTPAHSKNTTTVEFDPRLWCVRFLKDDTFMWATYKDISTLTKDEIQKFLNSKKAKKTIRGAYEMALDPPDVEEFIIYGSNGKPIAIDNEANDADFEDEYIDEELDQDVGDDDEEDDEEQSSDLSEEEPVAKKRGKKASSVKRGTKRGKKQTSTKSSPVKQRKTKKQAIPKVEEPETSSDEDWEADGDDTESPVAIDVPSAKELSDELKKKTPIVKKARVQLQKALLDEPEIKFSDIKSTVTTTLDSLHKIEPIQPSLIKQFNLHKVLFDILKRSDLLQTKDLKKLRDRIDKFVRDTFDVVIDVDTNWSFNPEEEEKIDEAEDTKSEEVVKTEETNGAIFEETNSIEQVKDSNETSTVTV